jgi:hypothetical protein
MAALADIELPQASLLESPVCCWPLQPPSGVIADPFPKAPRAETPSGAPTSTRNSNRLARRLASDIRAPLPRYVPSPDSIAGSLEITSPIVRPVP